MKRFTALLLTALAAGCAQNMPAARPVTETPPAANTAAQEATLVTDEEDTLVMEAENLGYYIPVFKQLSSEQGDFSALADKMRDLDKNIFRAIGSGSSTCSGIATCPDELSDALARIKSNRAAISTDESLALITQLTALMEATQTTLNQTGKGLYFDTEKDLIVILPLDEIKQREQMSYQVGDFDSALPAIADDGSGN